MNPTLQVILGMWRAVLQLPDAELPFNFELKKDNNRYVIEIINAEERIRMDDITVKGDSMFARFAVYDSEFKLKLSNEKMEGVWVNYSRKGNPAIPLTALAGNKERFIRNEPSLLNVSGRWETWFNSGKPDSSLAIGVLCQEENNKVKGTFLAAGGDHRYLDGRVTGNVLWLSVFDGSHCWLYKAEINGDEMTGTWWSGNHYKSSWKAKRNENIKLPDQYKITSVEADISFTFPDADSNLVSLSDNRYQNKVVILQILGSWCPNCIDESEFLSRFYKDNKAKGIEIIGLAFEKTTDFGRAAANVKRLRQRLGIEYPVLIAGTVGKQEVENKLPGIKNFSSYPTTIYINRNKQVAKVYSGFSGPATGIEFEKYKTEMEETIKELLK